MHPSRACGIEDRPRRLPDPGGQGYASSSWMNDGIATDLLLRCHELWEMMVMGRHIRGKGPVSNALQARQASSGLRRWIGAWRSAPWHSVLLFEPLSLKRHCRSVGRQCKIMKCDGFTRNWYATRGVDVGEEVKYPDPPPPLPEPDTAARRSLSVRTRTQFRAACISCTRSQKGFAA